jgi:carbon storage regulator
MLSISRYAHESIRINNNVKVTVVSIHENRVILGIEAPTEVPVHREEIQREIELACKT